MNANKIADANKKIDTGDTITTFDTNEFVSKAVLMVDIVEFSLRVGEKQAEAIRILILMLDLAIPANHNTRPKRIWSPAGDGGALTFWDSIRVASDTAFALAKLVNSYNDGEFVDKSGKVWPRPSNSFRLRQALHLGPVVSARDFDGRENIWGDGINMAARVMSLAKPDQILASKIFANTIKDSVGWPSNFSIQCIGKLRAKHDTKLVPYNIYSPADGIGISYSDSEEWFALLRRPLEIAVSSYESMANEEIISGNPFRAAILAKMILDLKPSSPLAQDVIRAISRSTPNGSINIPRRVDEFLSPLSYKALLFFFDNSEFDFFEEGQVIAEEGASADFLMVVISGEIHLSKQGQRITAESSNNKKCLLTQREGSIIGEMGLFDARAQRSATLIAYQRTIVLRIKYSCLQSPKNTVTPEESRVQQDIREQIWSYYMERTKRNSINYNSLLQNLPESIRDTLLSSDKSEFLPSHYRDQINLSSKEAWNSWIIVVSGNITFSGNNGSTKSLQYQTGDLVGPMRLVMDGQTPFSKVKVAPGTHLVLLDQDTILGFIQSHQEFQNACAAVGLEEKLRAGFLRSN